MRNVIVFAHECAPYNSAAATIGAQRPAQFAKYLPEFGWRAIVICRNAAQDLRWSQVRSEEVGKTVRDSLEAAAADASVIIPTPSLKADGALDSLWHWANRKRRGARRWSRPLSKALTTLKFCTGDHSQSWQPCAQVAADEVARNLDIHCCIGEHSPDAGLFLARWFAGTHGVPWIADFRDRISSHFSPVARHLYRPLAKRLVAPAAAVVNVTPVWAEMDGTLFGLPAHCITNGFDPEEFRGCAGPSRDRFELFAAGKLNIGHSAMEDILGVVCSGLRRFLGTLPLQQQRAVVLSYTGIGHERVVRIANRHGLSEHIEAQGRTPREAVLMQMRRASLLLITTPFPRDVAHPFYAKGMYPGKVFEYFGARRPILCTPGDNGILDDLIRTTRTGKSCATPESVAIFLAAAFAQWQKRGCADYEPDERAVAVYSRAVQARQMAALLDAVVSAGRAA